MFTGLIEQVGHIEQVRATDAGKEFRVRAAYAGLMNGESIALNGACLTVREHGSGWFAVAAVATTLGRTTMGDWHEGKPVNLERSVRVGDRLGGHLVQGHVDGVGTVKAVTWEQDALLIDVALTEDLQDFMVPHGSVCIDGVSLTVNELLAEDVLQVSIIEYTRRHTTLADLKEGQRVHVEADIIGKYVQRLVAPYITRARQ
ncbi:MAG: riboflavin synthase [Anaerolineae bacterium]|nr:riboflavin synthase [Gemmatimonadaceae bacterium]